MSLSDTVLYFTGDIDGLNVQHVFKRFLYLEKRWKVSVKVRATENSYYKIQSVANEII